MESGALPASTSFTLMPERDSEPSSFTDMAAGAWLSGASLTGCTSMGSTSLSPRAPPLPVLPRSSVTMVSASWPLKSCSP
ncbi:hypothetical protein D3C78_1224040 [compost metagenome]